MAGNIFLKIDGIDGDCSEQGHPKWIEVMSFSEGFSQAGGGSASAQGAHAGARVDIADFTVSKGSDSSSPNIALFCCSAKHIASIKMEVCRTLNDENVAFMVYEFKDSIISSFSVSGSGDSVPMETLSIRFAEIHWDYIPTDPTGGGKKQAAVKFGWSTHQNKKV